MKYKIDATTIAIFSDPHFGESKDNLIKMNTAEAFIDKFIEQTKKKTDVVFCLGDWFHNRNSINVHTNHIAYQNMKKLANNFKVYLVVGNHDTYFKHTVEINSLKQFEEIENITVIEKTSEIDFNGKSGLFCPWHFDPNNYKDKNYDYLFGHFEMNGVAFCGTVSKGAPYNMVELAKLSSMVFAGHYHIRKSYSFKEGKVITVGCPYEQTWGDINNKKGYYILDVIKDKVTFVENKISPVHFKYYLSQLLEKNQKLSRTQIKNNYIKLCIDCKCKFTNIVKILEKINEFEPIIKAEPEYTFNLNDQLLDSTDDSMIKIQKLTNMEYISKFIEKMELDDSLVKSILIDYTKEYYERCIINEA